MLTASSSMAIDCYLYGWYWKEGGQGFLTFLDPPPRTAGSTPASFPKQMDYWCRKEHMVDAHDLKISPAESASSF
eukprot:1158955-Pelagomonas_calceolata.AAC.4